MRQWAPILMVVGVMCILLGSVLPDRKPETVWSEERAQTRMKRTARAHQLHGPIGKTAQKSDAHDDHHAHGAGSDEEREEAKRNFEQSNEELAAARSAATLPKRIFFWGGIAVAVAGLACFGYERVTNG